MDRGSNPDDKGIKSFAEQATQYETTSKLVDAQTSM